MTWSAVIAVTCGLGVGIGAGFLLATVGGQRGHADVHAEAHAEHADAEPVRDEPAAICHVRVAKLERGDLPLPIAAFGTVVVAPAGIVQVVAPYECRIGALVAVEGALVAADAPLVELSPSVDTLAQRDEARLTRTAAERDLAGIRERLDLRLATVQELSQAQAAADLARRKAETWEQRLAEGAQRSSAGVAARVGKLLVRVGQLVPMGAPLVELQRVGGANNLEVRIGLDPADAVRVTSGQVVTVTALRRSPAAPLALMIDRLAAQVAPENRLLDAILTVPADAGLLPGEAVRAELPLTLADVLIVPRQALVHSDDGWSLFTMIVRQDERRALRHRVELLAENRTHAAIAAIAATAATATPATPALSPLKPGDEVIVEGNAEVADGMELRVLGGDAP